MAPPENTIAFGVAKLARFSILKHSARISKDAFSSKRTILKSDKSSFRQPRAAVRSSAQGSVGPGCRQHECTRIKPLRLRAENDRPRKLG